ncbi:MAG: exodeoxyribonuclease VII small subunit [Porticoccaceae bacterium]|nr:exodeoxyribonuclease VII small subunit [Pseudomonadales bacterium]MCP5170812.1 exodeoxyribonuclease VII small subunit [Pseudomonadales bacterium]MCP5301948.1 exodeoxyribonuclease VII small subunit [Pseudomonadales bacterium]
MASRKKPIDFEKSLNELEALVEDMEQGNLNLEESLKAFEKGIKITRDCQQALTEAEQKVELLKGGQVPPVEQEDDAQ